jgi:hypothetical protein
MFWGPPCSTTETTPIVAYFLGTVNQKPRAPSTKIKDISKNIATKQLLNV